MKPFWLGHATHPDWRMALALAAAQIEAQRAAEAAHLPAEPVREPTLGWLYITDAYATEADALLTDARQRWPGVAWVGASGVGVAATGVEYFDEPGLALMLGDLPREQFRVFSGAQPLGDFVAHTAQVHADPMTTDLPELIADMSHRTETGYLFGGLASVRHRTVHIADGVLQGGLSGVAFGADVTMVSRTTQGCQPIGPTRTITASERNVVTTLDDEPALDALLHDLGLDGTPPREAVTQLRQTLIGLSDAPDDADDALRIGAFSSPARRGAFGTDTRVRHLIGIDPARRGLAIGDMAEIGMRLSFCTRNMEAARRDLMRICAEIREELEPDTLPIEAALNGPAELPTEFDDIDALGDLRLDPVGEHRAHHRSHAVEVLGAIYVSCAGRGGPHFGAPSAELALIRHALGDVPLVGFFAAGEIARQHLYGYTGVLTVFTNPGLATP